MKTGDILKLLNGVNALRDKRDTLDAMKLHSSLEVKEGDVVLSKNEQALQDVT